MTMHRPAAPCAHVDITLVMAAGISMEKAWRRLAEKESDALLMDHFGMLAEAEAGRDVLLALRLRLIACRDATMDMQPFDVSPFYTLPQEMPAMRQFARSVRLTHGLRRSSVLEGVTRAMHGCWTQATRRWHIVAVVTDGGAYLPEDPACRVDAGYRAAMDRLLPDGDMPGTMEALRARWNSGAGTIDRTRSSMYIAAPAIAPWMGLTGWRNAVYRKKHTLMIQQCDPARLLAGMRRSPEEGGVQHE